MKFNTLPVSEVRRETDDCVSVAFEVPSDLQPFYRFIPGQYLVVEQTINGDRVRRSYSICSHPEDGLRIAIKKVEGGIFSTWANEELQPGMVMDVALPEGNFIHESDAANTNYYVAFAAGSGITPVLSIINSVLRDEPNSHFVLFYGNRSSNNIIFKEELEDLKNIFIHRFELHHIFSRETTDSPLFNGRINAEKCHKFFNYFIQKDRVSKIFLCGPYEMIVELKDALPTLGIESNKIKLELFYNPEADKERSAYQSGSFNQIEKRIRITLDGLTSDLQSAFDVPILDMAVDAGMDLPYSCKGGVCATCKAKVETGQIEMTTNFALEEEEVEAGYVLTCQAHVKSDFVHVNFDV